MKNEQASDLDFGEGLKRMRTVIDFFQPTEESKGVEQAVALLHPEVQVLGAPGVGPAKGYTSRDDFLAYFTEIAEHGVWIDADAKEIRIAPSGAVLVTATLQLRGPHGADTTPAWFVLLFQDELIVSLQTHLDRRLAESALQPES